MFITIDITVLALFFAAWYLKSSLSQELWTFVGFFQSASGTRSNHVSMALIFTDSNWFWLENTEAYKDHKWLTRFQHISLPLTACHLSLTLSNFQYERRGYNSRGRAFIFTLGLKMPTHYFYSNSLRDLYLLDYTSSFQFVSPLNTTGNISRGFLQSVILAQSCHTFGKGWKRLYPSSQHLSLPYFRCSCEWSK